MRYDLDTRIVDFPSLELQVKIVFHFGAHKTGSTLIQNALRKNIGLLSDAGWGYKLKKDWRMHSSPIPADFYLKRRRDRDLRKARDSLMRFLDAHEKDKVIVSSEGTLASTNPRVPHFLAASSNSGLYQPEQDSVVDWFSEVFSGLDVTAVFYVRRQDSFLNSLFLENVRQGRRIPRRRLVKMLDVDKLSWRPVLQRLRESFNLEARCFESIKTAGSDEYVRDFFRILDDSLSDQISVPERDVNVSLREPFLGLAVDAARLFKNSDSKSHKRFVRKLLRVQVQVHDVTEQPTIFGKRLLNRIEQRYQQDNLAIVDEYLSGLSVQHHSGFLWD